MSVADGTTVPLSVPNTVVEAGYLLWGVRMMAFQDERTRVVVGDPVLDRSLSLDASEG